MKVIFLEDVANVAQAGDTREVADGYGRNYLLPKKLAVMAGSEASSVVEAQLRKIAKRRAQNEAEMAQLAEKLAGVEVTLKARTGEKGRLYGSITSADIAGELESSLELAVDKKKIELEEPIRQLGSHDVTIRFTHDITAVIKVTVIGEEAVGEEKEEAKETEKEAAPASEEKETAPEEKAAKPAAKKKRVKAEKKEKEGETVAEDTAGTEAKEAE